MIVNLRILVFISSIGLVVCGTAGRAATWSEVTSAESDPKPYEAKICAPRTTDVIGALKQLTQTWDLSLTMAKGWTISTGDDSTRSSYEIYARYAGLSYVLGVSVETALTMLDQSGKVGPDNTVSRHWNWEDYSRMGEAALIAGRPLAEAMVYLEDVRSASTEWWRPIDYSRAAAVGFIAGVSAQHTYNVLHQAYKASDYSNWSDGAFSRAAEAALSAGVSAETAARMMDEVYRESRLISSRWEDDDYARVARAALIMGVSAYDAAALLSEVYDKTTDISSGWHNRDYSRMTSAAIITGKSAREAAKALKSAWDNRKDYADGWNYADYAMMAAAGLIGQGQSPEEHCFNLYKAW